MSREREFIEEIREHLPSAFREVLFDSGTFSTTTPLFEVCNSIALMDCLQNYFSYRVDTTCGIPQIILRGTVDDWHLLRHKILSLSEELSGDGLLDSWFGVLGEVMNNIIATIDGEGPPEEFLTFWRSIYKFSSGSGGDRVSGWILAFFPYLEEEGGEKSKNWIFDYSESASLDSCYFCSIPSYLIPNGLSSAPFSWVIGGRGLEYCFVGGFVGVRVADESISSVKASIGWAVMDCTSDTTS